MAQLNSFNSLDKACDRTNLTRNIADEAYRSQTSSSSNDIQIPASGVIWRPNEAAAGNLICMKVDEIQTLEDWLRWFERNILRLQCAQKAESCQVNINGQIMSLKRALSSCLGLSSTYNTIAKVANQEFADAGNIPLDLNCPEISALFVNCVADALQLSIPERIFGLDITDISVSPNIDAAYQYDYSNKFLTKLTVSVPQNDINNQITDLKQDVRVWPTAVVSLLDNARGTSFNAVTGAVTIGTDGWYVYDCNLQSTITYTKNLYSTSAYMLFNHALKVTDASNNNSFREIRISAPRRILWDDDKQPVNAKGAMILKLGKGDTVTPYFWLGTPHPSPIDLQFSTGGLNQWSLTMLPEKDVEIVG